MRKKKRKRGGRSTSLEPHAMMHTFYGEVVTGNVSDQVTIALRVDGVSRKILKILFRKASPDFYVALPYLKVNRFQCGLVRTEGGIPYELTPGIDVQDARVPVKLSYHESGVVHLKAQSRAAALQLPLTELQSTPIANFGGTLIFTVELEGLESFAPVTNRDLKKQGFFCYDVPRVRGDSRRIKITAFAGFAEDLVIGKHVSASGIPLRPTSLLTLYRAQFPVPLYIGLYMQCGPSIQTERRGSVYEMLLAGFTQAASHEDYIFMHARV